MKISTNNFEMIKEAVADGRILVGVDPNWALKWWQTIQPDETGFLGAHLLLFKNWGFFIAGIALLIFRQWLFALLSLLMGVVVIRQGRRQFIEEFRKHVMSNPQSFARFYSLGAITLKLTKTGKTIGYPQKMAEVIKEIEIKE